MQIKSACYVLFIQPSWGRLAQAQRLACPVQPLNFLDSKATIYIDHKCSNILNQQLNHISLPAQLSVEKPCFQEAAGRIQILT